MKFFITGGAGFIGSNLFDRLLANSHEAVVYDNFSTGLEEFLTKAKESLRLSLINNDTLNLPTLIRAMKGSDFIFHLAANADMRFGIEHPEKDLQQNTIATFNVLEAMRQTPLYGASKLACEGSYIMFQLWYKNHFS